MPSGPVYYEPSVPDSGYGAPETSTTSPDSSYGPSPPVQASSHEQKYIRVSTPRNYIPPRVSSISAPRYSAPSPTTERSYTLPKVSTARRYTVPTTTTTTTTTPKPYTTKAPRRYTVPPTTPRAAYGVPKLVSVRKYIRPNPTTESTVSHRTKSSGFRSRGRYTSTTPKPKTSAPQSYRRPTTEVPSHAIYFKPDEKKQSYLPVSSASATSGKRTSYKSKNRRQYKSQETIIDPSYSSKDLAIKSVSVATSSSAYLPSSSRSKSSQSAKSRYSSRPSKLSRTSSRSGSSYKPPTASSSPSALPKAKNISFSKASESRAGSKYESPIYVTSTKVSILIH